MANRIGTLTTPLYLVFFIAAVLMVSGSTAWSQEAKWTVASASKARILVPGGTWQPLTVETALAPGAEIKVGPGGRAVIEQNGDIVTLSPNSHMKVPAPKTAGGTSILQKLGTMLFKVRKRDPRLLNLVGTAAAKETPFKVETPYLAAVIKGTIFSVNVSPQGSALHVTEGLVEAISVSTGERGLVRPGQTAPQQPRARSSRPQPRATCPEKVRARPRSRRPVNCRRASAAAPYPVSPMPAATAGATPAATVMATGMVTAAATTATMAATARVRNRVADKFRCFIGPYNNGMMI